MEPYLKVVKLLLTNGAPVNSKDRHNATPIFLAVNCGSCEATQMLIGNTYDCMCEQYSSKSTQK